MPWKCQSVMDNRIEFVRLALTGEVSVSELCRRFGVSRQTGHACLRRYHEDGFGALAPRSSRPHSSPRRSSDTAEDAVVQLRTAHPAWGGRKLARRLRDLGTAAVPAPSTVTAILRRHDLLGKGGPEAAPATGRFERAAPNALWQMDFKGHFATDSGRCHPLTVLDDHCRYALGLRACGDQTAVTVRSHLTDLFRHYGLPWAMLADNGSPWGDGTGTHSALEVWLMRLGVKMLHGRPYHPQTQGKDERFHRTLNVQLLQARRFADLADCQSRFETWRRIYNEQRPHEALNLDTPASRYRPSPVTFPETLPEPQYDAADQVRRVRPDGYIQFKGCSFKLSQAFTGQHVALRQTQTDGLWSVHFMRFHIANLDLITKAKSKPTVSQVSEHV